MYYVVETRRMPLQGRWSGTRSCGSRGGRPGQVPAPLAGDRVYYPVKEINLVFLTNHLTLV